MQALDPFRNSLSRAVSAGNYAPHSPDSLLLGLGLCVIGGIFFFYPKGRQKSAGAEWLLSESEKNDPLKLEEDRINSSKAAGAFIFFAGICMFAYWAGWMDIVVNNFASNVLQGNP